MEKPFRLLLEKEAAEILSCSTRTIRHLRLTGRLPYIRGRPVLIDERDLATFIEERRQRKGAGPVREDTPECEIPARDRTHEIQARARRKFLARKLRAKHK